MKVKSESEVAQSSPTLSDPMDYRSLAGCGAWGCEELDMTERLTLLSTPLEVTFERRSQTVNRYTQSAEG